jgi:hypothetical protein
MTRTTQSCAFDFFGPSLERDLAIEQGMHEEEYGALMFIATVDDLANPECGGRIVVHADGTIECEGGCEGVRYAYHRPGSTVACDVAGGSASWCCSRCKDDLRSRPHARGSPGDRPGLGATRERSERGGRADRRAGGRPDSVTLVP